MIEFFQSFLTKMRASFRRIAYATRHEKEVDDLHNDAFVLALEIGERRGRHIDFSDPEDQDLVMRALYVEHVKRGDWKLRRAARIDHEPEGEEDGTRLIDRLPAPESSDPLCSLLLEENHGTAETLLVTSYSQAAAYVVAFGRLIDRQRICAHLVISEWTLRRRVSYAVAIYRRQPSMFDGKECIPTDFFPLPGRSYAAKIEEKRDARQWAWNFEEAHETL